MRDFYSYDPSQGHGLRHEPIGGLIAPRPIGWFGTKSLDGQLNLAPYSFFNLFNYHPPILLFSSLGVKDTLRNIIDTGVFTWNLATRDLAEQMNLSCTHEAVDEFEFAGLTPLASDTIEAPRVTESPVSMECRVIRHEALRDIEGQVLDTYLVQGQVMRIHLDKTYIDERGVFEAHRLHAIARAGGRGDYYEMRADNFFEMIRPR